MIRKLKISCLYLLVGTVNALSDDGKCRILSLRGGGIHGVWEVGVLQAFMDSIPMSEEKDEFRYDYVGGVSIGAVNAAAIAIQPPG